MSKTTSRLDELTPEQRRLLAQRLQKRKAADAGDAPAPAPVDDVGEYPLSFAQQRLWMLERLAPGGTAYNLPAALRVRDELKPEHVQRAINEVVRRHGALRTRFEQRGDQSVQVVEPYRPVAVPLDDLSDLPQPEREAALARMAHEDANAPFDLERGPPFRARVVRMGPADVAILVNMHHIVSDGWSMDVFWRELTAFVISYEDGAAPNVRPLVISFGEHARRQRERLSADAFTEMLAWWRKELDGAPHLLELPTDHPRPAVASGRGGFVVVDLHVGLGPRVQDFAVGEVATPFMVLLAAYQLLLGRYAGRDGLLVGTAIAGRDTRDVEPLIGFFANTLAVRGDLTGNPTFRDLVQRVRTHVLGAFAHQELPFERLVEELSPERSLAWSPLVQTVFLARTETLSAPRPGPAPEGAGVVEGVRQELGASKFDLTLSVGMTHDRVLVGIEYATDLFERDTVERLARHYGVLLTAALAGPDTRIGDLSMLADEERSLVLGAFTDGPPASDTDRSVSALFAASAAATPDGTALAWDEGRMTYAELDAESNRLAHHLRSRGARPGDRIGVMLERGPARVVSMLAALKAGCAYVPLDASYPAERLAFMLAEADARLVIADSATCETVDAVARDSLFPVPDSLAVVDLSAARADLAAAPNTPPAADPGPDALAYVIYTSGSTGRPKGVGVPHRAVVRLVRDGGFAEFGPEATWLHLAPSTFDAATLEVWAPLLNGGRLVLYPDRPPSPKELGATIRGHGVTHLWLTAGLFHLVADEDPDALAGVRHLLAGGDVLSIPHARRVMEAHPELRLTNGYGPTENTTFTTCHDLSAADWGRASLPVGRPVAGTRAYVLDAGLGPVPVGVPGELYAGGDGLAWGYLRRPALTAERFVPDPFGAPGSRLYRTGDGARWLADGALEFLGRADQQVKVRGYRIETGEIEQALRADPRVGDAAVLARADGPGEKRLVAYVVPRDGAHPSSNELREALSARLPAYMVPGAFVHLDALPLTANGKVDRRALPAPGDVDGGDAFVAPRTPTEEVVAGIWAELLGAERVGAEDDFFALGGHSLIATQLISRVRGAFGVELPLRDVFEAPLLGAFAKCVDAAAREAAGMHAPPLAAVGGDDLPLSFAQERLWFIDRLEPGNPVYNMPFPLRMRGALDGEAMERALAEIVRRHASLRTRFAVVDGRPVQRVEAAEGWRLPVDDLTSLGEDARAAETERRLREWATAPFDLERGPLFRARLLRLADDDHVLLIGLHHVVSDGWSMGVFWRELTTLYRAFAAGQPSPLPEPALQYADFSVWQRAWLAGETLERQVTWWREHLAGAPALLELPTDRPRPATQSHRGDGYGFVIPAEVAEGVRALARRQGATLFMALLAAWDVLLSRWSGQDDVVIGTPVAGRTRRETEGLIGFFVNTLAIRGDLSGDPSFTALLGRVREATLGAYAHQDLPFERLVEELQPERSLSHAPIYQSMLVLQNLPEGPTEGFSEALTLEGAGGHPGVAKVDVMLGVMEGPDGELYGALEYATDLWDRATMERLGAHFTTLLRAAAATPDAPVSTLPLMADEERAEVVRMGAAVASYPVAQSLHARFATRAARTPDAPAVTFGERTLSYAELDARANDLARRLAARGAGADRLVGLCVERSLETVVGILGILQAGAAYLPLDPAYPDDRLAYMLEDSGARLVVTTADVAHRLPAGIDPVRLDDEADRSESAPFVPVEVSPDALAYVIYTSGSTGRPKGVQVTHANVARLFAATDAWFGFGAADVWTLFHSYAFDFSVWELWGALLYGGRLVVVPFDVSRDPARVLRLLQSERVTVLNQTPSAFRQLIRADDETGGSADLALRCVVFGGEALDPASLRGWVARRGDDRPRLVNMYGITETTVHVTWRVIREADVRAGSSSPIGIPIPDLSVHLLDRRGQPVPIGIVGEMHVGGAGVARGYLNRPELSAQRFVPDPFGTDVDARLYRSGDLARRLPDGSLEFWGRADDQVKVRGFRIELGEIESVLLEHPAVREAVVLARGGPDDRRLVAWVVAEEPAAAELRAHLLAHLPEYMVPSAFVPMDALPLTRNGKVDRRALPEPDTADAAGAAYVAPRTPTEEVLAGIWAELLGAARVGAADGFFELGGHSLLATRVVSRVRADFGVEVPVRAVFEHSVLESFAAELDRLLRASAGTEAPPLRPAARVGDLPLSFAQERLWFVDQMEPGSPVYHMPFQYLLRGPLDVDALRRALDEVVRRHEVLRTTLPLVDDVPMQRIAPFAPVELPVHDLSHLAEAERGKAAGRLSDEVATRAFDLAAGPLWRAALGRMAPDEHVLFVNLHHVISDGWSTGVLWNELSALYGAFRRGEASPLPELPIQYGDFAVWQREWLRGEVLEAQLGYWRRKLAGAPPLLELPTDRPRPAVQTYAGAAESAVLEGAEAAAVLGLARREGATLFMVLLAALDVVLGRLAGQEDVVVGTPIAGRTRRETEGLMGLFLNSLALRTDLSGQPSFRELLRRVRETTLEAYAHQDLPFERILEEVHPERSLSHTPVFQVMLNLSNFAEGDVSLPGLEVHPLGTGGDVGSKFDLTLYAGEAPGGAITLHLVYNVALFDAARVREMLAQLTGVLRQAADDVERPVGRLSLLTDSARSVLPDPAQPLSPEWRGSVPEIFGAHAARAPHALAVQDAAERWTYGELDAAANRVAHRLVADGVRRGEVVAVWAHRSAALPRALLAAWKAGAAFVVLDPAYPAARLAQYVRMAAPAALLRVPAAGEPPAEVAAALADTVRSTLVLHADACAEQPSSPPAVPVGPDDLAYVAFTSGTTGVPKAVAGTHRPLSHFFGWYADAFGPGPGDRVPLLAGLGHDPLLRDVFAPLWAGGAVVVPDPEEIGTPGYLAEWMRAQGASVAHLTPALGALLTRHAGDVTLPDLRLACIGGDVLRAADVRALRALAPGARVVNVYGATETPQAMGVHEVPAEPRPGAQPVGRGIPGAQLLVVNPAGELAGTGELGEVCIRTPYLSAGYRNDAELTAARFVPNPFRADPADRVYRTGDLGRYGVDGAVELAGRADQQVKVRGFRVEPGEVEAALRAHPAIRDAAVVARGEGDARRLVAYVVGEGEGADDGVRAHLRARLAEHQVPAAFVWLPAIPLTPNRKVDRRALPEPGTGQARPLERPLSGTEARLAEIWAELLGRAAGPDDDFFALGGHSLLATRLSARVRQALGVELPLRAIFEHPALARLAAEVERRAAVGAASGVPPLVPRPRGDTAPASFAQERMWFVDRLEGGGAVYHMPSAHRLGGALDLPALRRALDALVLRHESLRTALPEGEDGLPFQRILAPAPVDLPVHELAEAGEDGRGEALARLSARHAQEPFDLEAGPLFRAALARLAADDHVLLLNVHHAVSDGWSNRLLIRELTALYDAFRRGQPSPLPALPVQYADYALWQRRWLSGPVLGAQTEYWLQALQGAPPLLALPTDRPRPAVQTYRGASEACLLPREVAEGVRSLGRGEGATTFMVLLAAFAAVLGRWAGEEDVVVGTPVAGRGRAETEGVVGLFLNSLALRTDLSGAPTFRQLLRRVRETTLGAYAHQDVPFELVLQALRPARDPGRTPVFQVMLNLLNFDEAAPASAPPVDGERGPKGAVAVTPLGAGVQLDSKFDLTLYAAETPEGLALHLVYNADLFDAPRVREMLEQLTGVLRQAVEDVERPIRRLSLLTDGARSVLPDPAQPLSSEWRGSVPAIFAAHAARAPRALAVEDPAERWTYGELDADASRIAHLLLAGGVRPGDVVAIHGHRGAALVRALMGTLRAGAAFLVLDPAYPAARLAEYVRIAGPTGWLAIGAAGEVPAELADALRESVRATVPLGPRGGAIDATGGWERVDAPRVEIGPDSLAYLSFTSGTSGTSGRPKAVMGRHGSLTHFTPWLAERFELGAGDRFSLLSGLAHDPLHRDVFTPLQLGAAVVAPDPDEVGTPGYLARWMRDARITIAHLTPAMGQLLADVPSDAAVGTVDSLRRAFFVGDVLTRTDVDRLHRLAPNLRIVNYYGSTETQRAVAHFVVPRDPSALAKEIIPVGTGIPDVQLLIRTAAGERAGVGEVGEMWMRSPHIGLGYLGDPALTAARFVEGAYRTGDLGRYRPDGVAEIAGRADEQVKIRGFRIEPGEIEAALRAHPAVRDAVVVARGQGDGKRLVAYVAAEGTAPAADGMRAYLRGQVPDYMVPAAWVFMGALPVTPNGKVDRRALPEPQTSASLDARVAPRTPTETALAEIWSELLKTPVAAHDDFFALGGHSLLATRLIGRVRDALGVELPLRAIFQRPTLAAMAARVDGQMRTEVAAGPPPIVRRAHGGVAPASFAQERTWFVDRLEGGGPVYHVPSAHPLHGPVDVDAMRRALEEVVRRHETLRTSLPETDGVPVQRIAPPGPVEMPFTDLSHLSPGERDAEIARLGERSANEPFDLESGPLYRVSLVGVDADDHLLLVNLHHAIADGGSMRVLVGELSALHDAYRRGEPSPLPVLPVQYADYAAWQREWLRGPVLDAQLAYWRGRLADAPPLLRLPTDRPRPEVQGHRRATVDAWLPPEVASRAGNLARREGATVFMVLLAALNVVLSRWSGQDDVIVGTPIAGRTRPELEGLIGLFLNTLALRTDLSGQPTFAELLRRVRETTLEALAHQDLPFERVLKDLRPERSLSHAPVFQVLLDLRKDGGGEAAMPTEAGGGGTSPGAGAQLASRFDLTLYAAERFDGIALNAVYDAGLFDALRIQALLAQLGTVLRQAAEHPDRPVADLSLVTEVDAAAADASPVVVRTAAGAPAGIGELGEVCMRGPDGALRSMGGAGRYRPDGSVELATAPVAPPAPRRDPPPAPAVPPATDAADRAVASNTQRMVAEVWAEVLGVAAEGIAPDADFFALGGHSLRTTQVLARIRARTGARVPVKTFFADPTVAALAAAVDAERPAAAPNAPAAAMESARPAGTASVGEPLPHARTDTFTHAYPPGVYPLSFAQQRLWVLMQLGTSVAYNMASALRFRGALDDWALERALDEMVRRHETLRTRIEVRGDEPVQVVQPARPLRLRPEEVRADGAASVDDVLRRMAEAEAAQPFALEGPFLRVRLLRAGDDDHVLLWTTHHLVSDGWSLGVFQAELTRLYRSFASGEPSPLRPLPIQYGQHALEQRRALSGPALDALVGWWRERLAGAPALLELPTDRPRPTEPTGVGASFWFGFPQGMGERVAKLARGHGATPFMVMMAAFQALLSRWSGQDDVVVGTPIANRTRPEVEGLIGFFANTLAIRGDVRGDPTFAALLQRVREATLGAYEHQDIPFERLVEELNPERSLSHSPVFQVMFILQNAAGGEPEMIEGLAVSGVPREREAVKHDLSIALFETGDTFAARLDYVTALFDRATMDRFAWQMVRLLDVALADPDATLSSIDLLSDDEHASLAEWNRTDRDFSARTALEWFDGWVARTPDAPALAFEDERLTFAQLDARTRRIAGALVARGVGPEARVGLCVERSAEMIVALLGILRAGAAYLPLDPAFPPARMADMLADAGAPLVLAQDALLPVLEGIGAEVLSIGQIERNAPESVPLPEIRPESLAYVIYTSGSTGRPKGVAVEHRQLAHYVQAVAERLALPERASYATVSTVAADLGHTSVFGALCGGGCLHVLAGERIADARAFAAYLADNAVDALKITPSHLAALAGGGNLAAVLPRRCLIVGGEASRAAWVDEIRAVGPELRLVNHYGPTETTVGALAYVAPSELPDTSSGTVPIGRPLANARAYVLDAALRPVPLGIPGELCIGGQGVARGYLHRPALTAERFVPDPFAETPGARMYRTGDRARRLADGSVEFLGRIDQQVKVRGFRVEPGEVESILRAHPAIRDAAVVARADPLGTPVLVAYLVGAQGAAADGDALHRHCAARLPAYMVPAAFVPLDALPLTPNGKLDRAALPAPEGTGGDGYVVPRDVTELEVARIWSQALGVPRVGANDDFFRLGGHSLLAVRMLPRIRERFGRDLPLTTLFQHSTVAAFAAALRREGADGEDGRLRVTLNAGDGARPPLFFFPPAGGTVTHYADLARLMGPDQPFLAFQAPGVNGAEAPLTTVEAMVDRYLEEIRQVQPHGPYWLGGWSAGGLTAFETARRLRAEGEAVALLALVDPPAPDAQRETAPDQVALYRRFARSTVTGDEALLDALADELRALAPEERLAGLSRWITRHGGHVMDAELERVGRVMAVYEATARAVRDYRDPPPLDVPAVLFVATEGRAEDGFGPDVLPGRWRPFVAGELPVRLIPGVHAQLVLEPAAVALADALREAMEERRHG